MHALVLTHGDPDHVGGAEVMLERLRPANVWEGVPVPPHPVLQQLHQRAEQRQIVWRTVRPGDVERAGPVEIRVLHPPAPDWERQRVRNDDSVVLEVRYHDVSILLPGDIGREVEEALIPGLALGSLVVLKAAHHGSATSSSEAFIEADQTRRRDLQCREEQPVRASGQSGGRALRASGSGDVQYRPRRRGVH